MKMSCCVCTLHMCTVWMTRGLFLDAQHRGKLLELVRSMCSWRECHVIFNPVFYQTTFPCPSRHAKKGIQIFPHNYGEIRILKWPRSWCVFTTEKYSEISLWKNVLGLNTGGWGGGGQETLLTNSYQPLVLNTPGSRKYTNNSTDILYSFKPF